MRFKFSPSSSEVTSRMQLAAVMYTIYREILMNRSLECVISCGRMSLLLIEYYAMVSISEAARPQIWIVLRWMRLLAV